MRKIFTFTTRTGLFLLINILVFITLSVTVRILFSALGMEQPSYMTFYIVIGVVFGMGGALISLFLSKYLAKKIHKLKIIDTTTAQTQQEKWLVEKVYHFSKKAKITKMPEVALYQSPELNAFATGPSRNNSLVAVSSGLLEKMTPSEAEGVIAHEVSHIANGDMVTMALLQGVINTIAIFLGRIVARIVMNYLRSDSIFLYIMLSLVFEVLLTLLGSVGVYKFSRWREFRADRGGALLAGKEKMISALQCLQKNMQVNEYVAAQSPEAQQLNNFKISGRKKSSLLARLMSSHPPLESRIHALERLRIT